MKVEITIDKHIDLVYEHFVAFALGRRCTGLKAITTPGNTESIAFQRTLGMECVGKPNREGMLVIESYPGPGQDWVVFRKKLSQGGGV